MLLNVNLIAFNKRLKSIEIKNYSLMLLLEKRHWRISKKPKDFNEERRSSSSRNITSNPPVTKKPTKN